MPHYKDGTPAKHGDLVIHREAHDGGNEKVMIIQSITKNSDACNSNAIPVAVRQKGADSWLPLPSQLQYCITLKECEKIGNVTQTIAEIQEAGAVPV